MFITLVKPTNEEASPLQRVIDNTDGRLQVALREIHYKVSYSNLGDSAPLMVWTNYKDPNVRPRLIYVTPGLFTPERLSHFFMEKLPGLKMEIDTRGYLRLDITAIGGAIDFNADFGQILGIKERNWINGKYEGDRPVNISVHKWLYIYLDQLSTTSNLVDGAPSALLAIVPAAIDGVADITLHSPQYKKMEAGHIHQLNLRVLDEDGKVVDNRESPITTVLEIRDVHYTDKPYQ